jgi:hypothetical protein
MRPTCTLDNLLIAGRQDNRNLKSLGQGRSPLTRHDGKRQPRGLHHTSTRCPSRLPWTRQTGSDVVGIRCTTLQRDHQTVVKSHVPFGPPCRHNPATSQLTSNHITLKPKPLKSTAPSGEHCAGAAHQKTARNEPPPADIPPATPADTGHQNVRLEH